MPELPQTQVALPILLCCQDTVIGTHRPPSVHTIAMPDAAPAGLPAPIGHAALALLTLLPLVLHVPTNANIVLTAALTVWVGSWRSVKPEPPAEAMSKKVPPPLRCLPLRRLPPPRRLRACPCHACLPPPAPPPRSICCHLPDRHLSCSPPAPLLPLPPMLATLWIRFTR